MCVNDIIEKIFFVVVVVVGGGGGGGARSRKCAVQSLFGLRPVKELEPPCTGNQTSAKHW